MLLPIKVSLYFLIYLTASISTYCLLPIQVCLYLSLLLYWLNNLFPCLLPIRVCLFLSLQLYCYNLNLLPCTYPSLYLYCLNVYLMFLPIKVCLYLSQLLPLSLDLSFTFSRSQVLYFQFFCCEVLQRQKSVYVREPFALFKSPFTTSKQLQTELKNLFQVKIEIPSYCCKLFEGTRGGRLLFSDLWMYLMMQWSRIAKLHLGQLKRFKRSTVCESR